MVSGLVRGGGGVRGIGTAEEVSSQPQPLQFVSPSPLLAKMRVGALLS